MHIYKAVKNTRRLQGKGEIRFGEKHERSDRKGLAPLSLVPLPPNPPWSAAKGLKISDLSAMEDVEFRLTQNSDPGSSLCVGFSFYMSSFHCRQLAAFLLTQLEPASNSNLQVYSMTGESTPALPLAPKRHSIKTWVTATGFRTTGSPRVWIRPRTGCLPGWELRGGGLGRSCIRAWWDPTSECECEVREGVRHVPAGVLFLTWWEKPFQNSAPFVPLGWESPLFFDVKVESLQLNEVKKKKG